MCYRRSSWPVATSIYRSRRWMHRCHLRLLHGGGSFISQGSGYATEETPPTGSYNFYFCGTNGRNDFLLKHTNRHTHTNTHKHEHTNIKHHQTRSINAGTWPLQVVLAMRLGRCWSHWSHCPRAPGIAWEVFKGRRSGML